jgi:alkylation response protein AidB-like acyl-CoA dehydrogenase
VWCHDQVPAPGVDTWSRWTTLVELGAWDLAKARLAEGHLDARAIGKELGRDFPAAGSVVGVWAAEPERLRAHPDGRGWRLVGEKPWCSGATGIDHALVSATAPDGPRLFVVEPARLEPVAGSWPALGMDATASLTMRFDVTLAEDRAWGGPGAYVDRPGFWHGGAGVAACWFGGALGIARRLQVAADAHRRTEVETVWGRVRARLEGVAALLRRSAAEIDEQPADGHAARGRALRLRLVVEEAARATLAETTVALGAGPLAHEREHAQRVADLDLYLRQLRPDHAAAELAGLDRHRGVIW